MPNAKTANITPYAITVHDYNRDVQDVTVCDSEEDAQALALEIENKHKAYYTIVFKVKDYKKILQNRRCKAVDDLGSRSVGDVKQIDLTQRECDLLCHVITGVLHGWAQSGVEEVSEVEDKELRVLRKKLADIFSAV